MTEPATHWREALRANLLTARKERDAIRVSALRSALSAIDNAETPDGTVPSAGALSESAVGPGAAEVARRALTDTEIRALLTAEVDERWNAAAELAAHGAGERAETVRAEAAVLIDLLS
jgi:uncharacterized protein YqeY